MPDLIAPPATIPAAVMTLPGVDLLSSALRAVGSDGFYPALVAWVGSVIPSEIWFVTQYSRSQKPVILHDNWDRSDAKAFYMQGVHEYDPTYHVLGDEVLMSGTSMAHVAERFSLDRRYADYLDNVARIRDELIIVLPRLDDRYIAIGLDRSADRFSSDEIHLARTLSSLLAEMHRLHVERAGGTGRPSAVVVAGNAAALPPERGVPPPTLEHFARRQGLTPRETEITSLCLRGYPNAAIARALSISRGVVKNHKLRLYRKLDITTERELFSLFLETNQQPGPKSLTQSDHRH
jgi:DNA-binding CsgD family transcriptional regulator